MEKTDVNTTTALAIFFVATAVVLIGGLAIVPTIMQSASASHGGAHGSGGGCGRGAEGTLHCGGSDPPIVDNAWTGGIGGGGSCGEGGGGSGGGIGKGQDEGFHGGAGGGGRTSSC